MGEGLFRQGPDHDTPGLLMSARETRSQARRRVFRRRQQVAATGLVLCCALLVLGGFRLAAAFTERSAAEAESLSGAGSTPATSATAGVRNLTPGSGVYALA